MNDYQELLGEATHIAEQASKVALSFFRQALLVETKPDQSPVTVADKKTEELVRKELRQRFPDHGIIGEELGLDSESAEYVWTIDPIDGTRSFVRGIPLFGTLLGLLHNKEPVLGVMVLPALNETYIGAKGTGAFCNGIRIRVSSIKTLEDSLISFGDVYCFDMAGKTATLKNLISKGHLVRGYTDCFGHAMVARGAIDAMIDPVVSMWDVVPVVCIIQEAGGVVFNLEGHQDLTSQSLISCTPGIRDMLLKL